MTTDVLTIRDAVSLASLCDCAIHTWKVAWVDPTTNDIMYGTARHFVVDPDRPYFIGVDTDVRDSYLRITTTGGFETFLKVSDLIPMVHAGTFI
jgi:hypothetical protein